VRREEVYLCPPAVGRGINLFFHDFIGPFTIVNCTHNPNQHGWEWFSSRPDNKTSQLNLTLLGNVLERRKTEDSVKIMVTLYRNI
jgi:hypothetical protein